MGIEHLMHIAACSYPKCGNVAILVDNPERLCNEHLQEQYDEDDYGLHDED